MKNKFSHTDKGVRDLPQKAEYFPDTNTIKCSSFIGNKRINSCEFNARDFDDVWKRTPGNPYYSRRKFIEKVLSPFFDYENGDIMTAERIIDAHYRAVTAVLQKAGYILNGGIETWKK